jgi:hypothetical protein
MRSIGKDTPKNGRPNQRWQRNPIAEIALRSIFHQEWMIACQVKFLMKKVDWVIAGCTILNVTQLAPVTPGQLVVR